MENIAFQNSYALRSIKKYLKFEIELQLRKEFQQDLANKRLAFDLLKVEYDSQEYARNRKVEYPPIADQQDMQFHDAIDGTTTWQDAIQAVKTKYPKPE